MSDAVVVDASALVDSLLGNRQGEGVRERIARRNLHSPGHLDAEVLSALGRLERDGQLTDGGVLIRLERLTAAPVERHAVASLAVGAWHRRHNFRLTDALYVELALQLRAPLITTDKKLANATGIAELVTG